MKEEINAILTNIKATLYERANDPVLSTFILFFTLRNWKPLYILIFDKRPATEVISSVRQDFLFPIVFNSTGVSIWNWDYYLIFKSFSLSFGIPIILTTIYFLFYLKYKKKWISWIQEKEVEIINAKKRESEKILLDPQQSSFLYTQINELESRLKQESIPKNDFPELRAKALSYFSKLYGGQDSEYKIVRFESWNLHKIFGGLWIIHSLNNDRCSIFQQGSGLQPEENFGIVLEIIDEKFAVIKFRGDFDFTIFHSLKSNIQYENNCTYLISNTEIGKVEKYNSGNVESSLGWRIVCVGIGENKIRIANHHISKDGFRFNISQ